MPQVKEHAVCNHTDWRPGWRRWSGRRLRRVWAVPRATEVLDPVTKKWAMGTSMKTARACLGLAAFDSELFAVGGWSGAQQKALADVEVFDTNTSTWNGGSPMMTGHNGLALAALGGKLHAAGGTNTTGDNLRSVEMLALGATSWAAVASMKIGREGHGLAALGGKLYAVGGAQRRRRCYDQHGGVRAELQHVGCGRRHGYRPLPIWPGSRRRLALRCGRRWWHRQPHGHRRSLRSAGQ